MPLLPDIAPVRAVRGLIYGMEEGFVGKTDANEKFSDGKWENDPEKKSKAGRFASENLGLLGSAEKGEKVGRWAGAIAAATVAGSFLFTAYLPAALAAGVVAGFFPVLMCGVLTAAAAWFAADLGAFVGRNVAKPFGAVAGMAVGSVVGTFNAIFKRGAFKEAAAPDAPAAGADAQAGVAQEAAPPQDLPAPAQQPAPQPMAHNHGQSTDIQALTRALQQAGASGAARPDLLLPAGTPYQGPGQSAEGQHVANLRAQQEQAAARPQAPVRG